MGSVECSNEAYNVGQISVLHDMLPDGDERNYIAAIHDAVEGLNDFSMNGRAVYDFAHHPDRADRLAEEFSRKIDRFQDDIKKALETLSSFGNQNNYTLRRGSEVGKLLAKQNKDAGQASTGLSTKFEM